MPSPRLPLRSVYRLTLPCQSEAAVTLAMFTADGRGTPVRVLSRSYRVSLASA